MDTMQTNRQAEYLQLCENSTLDGTDGRGDNTINAPLYSWSCRQALLEKQDTDGQHGLLGFVPGKGDENELILVNSSHPWSAFICGSQGTGKSYTTSCLLENCLSTNKDIGTLQNPMAGMVFRYDRYGSGYCEAATLCKGKTKIKVQVLVSPFNFQHMRKRYEREVQQVSKHFEIKPFYLKSEYLNAERIQKFMASSDGSKPLYMSVVDRVLREMGLHNQGPQAQSEGVFTYADFKKRLGDEQLTELQTAPLKLRLSLLESYMERKPLSKNKKMTQNASLKIEGDWTSTEHLMEDKKVEGTLTGQIGCLKILDLTDPQIDRASACTLFDLALAVFMNTEAPKAVALDEAHNYLNGNEESEVFTEDLLKVVREQRHSGTRLIVTTQEPTISPRFLDLCSISIVHRFTSPEWFRALRAHIGGASAEAGIDEEKARALFRQIGTLRIGESLVFSPTALLDVHQGVPQTLEFGSKQMKTRKRISADGGKSQCA